MTDPVPSKDLLPCPFCGKAAKVYGVNLVGCVDTVSCGAQVDWGHFYGPDPVIAAWNKRAAPEGIDRLQRDNARLETLLRLAEEMREPEPYYAALNRLTVAMGNPALSWKDGETIESALIDEAARRLSAPEPCPVVADGRHKVVNGECTHCRTAQPPREECPENNCGLPGCPACYPPRDGQ